MLKGVNRLRSVDGLVMLGSCILHDALYLGWPEKVSAEGGDHGTPILGGHMIFDPGLCWSLRQ